MEEHNVPELFNMLDREIALRTERVQKLRETAEAFEKAPGLFDAGDMNKVRTVLRRREEELLHLCKDVQAAKELFCATVQGLEEKIRHKAAVLQAVDAELGTMSGEQELTQHFAQEQAALDLGMARAKHALVQTICNKLGPTLFGSGAGGKMDTMDARS